MDPRRLRHFLAVYEHGSLGRAAAELSITQPALSKSIHQLERELKVQLFDRTPKGLVPTVYGETLFLHARSVESELRAAQREIALLAGAAKGEVRVGVTPSVAATLLPTVALLLHRERPAIQLSVIEGLVEKHVPALRRGELDVVVGGWARGMHPDLRTEVVLGDVVTVFARAGHPLSGGRVELPQLLEYPWAMPPHTQFWLDHLDRTFVSRGLPPPLPATVSNSASFIRSVLGRSDFLTYLPALLLAHDRQAGEIVPLDAPELEFPIDINVTYRARAALPAAVDAFIEALRSACAAMRE